ncbi:multidrug effflux MFS transporter [Oceanicella actignis]|uniref:multidrug effflux MFS transporter n=1 Tax=Oceanicella actignis TaxID=1189325 RepID=UPI0011E62A7C|nr:multidrug effflux MFS transporter [Oceanicella actignis]TYO90664.1 DHA1 family bicyclomycin/chloramphenicol resistance-like MFS transporter [Oceanicella actignis]
MSFAEHAAAPAGAPPNAPQDAPPAHPPVRFLDRATPPHIATLVAMAALSALAMNMFLPSMPGIARWFGADYALIQLAVSGYLAVTGVLQLVIGPLSDRYGRRPVALTAFAIFTLASIGCVLAPNVETFLAFRGLQGAVAAGMVLSRAIVRDLHEPAAAASMIGYVTMGMSLAPMASPMLGGLLEELFGWQANFLVMAALGAATLALAWADLGETNRAPSPSLLAQARGYPELVRSQRFWGYALVTAFTSGAFFAFLGGAPFVASVMLGMEPARLGFYFGFIALGYLAGNFVTGRVARRAGIDRMLIWGTTLTLAAVSLPPILYAAGLRHPMAIFGPLLAVGLGNGLTMPNAMAGFLSVRPHLAGAASGLGGALMIGGGAALAATTGALLGPETGPYPLLLMMLGASAMALVCTLWVLRVSRRKGPVGAEP